MARTVDRSPIPGVVDVPRGGPAGQPRGSEAPVIARPRSGEPRQVALDGFRGLMTLFVLVSHYFAEIPHGVSVLSVGWIAVIAFFVLSGFLVGRLILERKEAANFWVVFYVRRLCRTLPVYLVCVSLVFACIVAFGNAAWLDVRAEFPLWSYLTFTQNFFFVATDSIGPHWLAPTWTLAVEEQFYLFAPALFFVVPRRHLLGVLGTGLVMAVGFRAFVHFGGVLPAMAANVTLPGVADTLICGLIAGVLMKTEGIDWRRYDLALRFAPVVLLVAVNLLVRLPGGVNGPCFQTFGGLLVAVASASFILALVRGAPEAKRFTSPVLCFFGRTSYTVYMTHLAVLGLMHGLILGDKPDLASPAQWAVTLAAVPVAVLIGWIGTRLVEEPITAYGRSWRWSEERRGQAEPAGSAALAAARS